MNTTISKLAAFAATFARNVDLSQPGEAGAYNRTLRDTYAATADWLTRNPQMGPAETFSRLNRLIVLAIECGQPAAKYALEEVRRELQHLQRPERLLLVAGREELHAEVA